MNRAQVGKKLKELVAAGTLLKIKSSYKMSPAARDAIRKAAAKAAKGPKGVSDA